MNVIVNGRHMEITDALKAYASEKVQKVEKYLPENSEASVMLSVEKFRHKAEVQIKANGLLIQAHEETEEMYSSIDKVMDKVGRQVKKYKERLKVHKGQGMDKVPAEVDVEVDKIPEVIKVKSFDMKPMTSEEAVMQMELLDKVFFVFSNINTGALNVIYKRRDGNVGLIEPLAK